MGDLARELVEPRRNQMERFTIDELSAVDSPAQSHALVTIMKRDDEGGGTPDTKPARKLLGHLNARPSTPIVHDDDPQTYSMLKLAGVGAMTYSEITHLETLEGDARRAFLLADHDTRAAVIASANTDTDNGATDNNQQEQQKDTKKMKFAKMYDAVAHYERTGMTLQLAKRAAASAHPELRYAVAADAHAKSAEGLDLAKAAAGASRRNQLDGKIADLMAGEKPKAKSRMDAMRMLRRMEPELFDDEEQAAA